MITRQKRKEYFGTTMALFVSSFLIYGCLGIFLEDTIFHTPWEQFLFWGCIAGLGFGSIFSGIILFTRYIATKSMIFRIICCCFFPLTAAIIAYIGVFSFLPYGIYNVYVLMKETKNRKEQENV